MRRERKKTASTAPNALQILWQEGFFKNWSDQNKITNYLGRYGNNFPPATLRMALLRAPYLTRRRKNGTSEYIQKRPAVSREVDRIESQLFDNELIKKLGKTFEQEIKDLHLNFGRSGNCTAFLLRKVLEKLIYIAFAKNNLGAKLEDVNSPGRLVGLETMVNIAAQEKVKGIPFIIPKTAQEIRGIKFLGDTSAHNPLVDVDMKTILPQMPFIMTAYKELAHFL